MTKRNLLFGLLMVMTLGAMSYAQQVIILKQTEASPAGGAVTADDTDVAMLIRYVGTNAGGGEVAVAAAGQISLTVATVADTSVECPVSGALGGIIDTTNAACNTLGEVCDAINGVNGAGGATVAAPSNFRCVILDGTRADVSDNSLFAFTIVPADAKAGLPIYWDTDSVHLGTSLALVPPEARSIDFYLGPAPSYSLRPFPFKNTRTFVDWAWEDSGTCTGADTFRIVAANDYTYGSETVVNLYGPIATNTTTPVSFDFSHAPIFGKFGAKVVAREICATSYAAGLLSVSAYQVPLVH